MEKSKRILGLIGLAARARKICFGTDSVLTKIRKKKVYLILIAGDASDRTKEKFEKLAKEYNIPIIIYGNIEEISKSIGKNNKAVIGIEDCNFANEIQKINDGGELIG